MELVSLAQHSAWLGAAERPEKPSYSKRTARPQPRYMPACGAENGASSITLVDSAFFGSHSDASFFWAPLRLPASGPAAAITAIQKARTTHLVHRPQGSPAILLIAAWSFPRSRLLCLTVPPSPGDARS